MRLIEPLATMKLRLRSLESKQTHRIEVPNTCSLQQLKEAITNQLSLSSPSSNNLVLSLNRKDELLGSTPQESLQSLGITSGDLIYFSQNPFAFSSQSFDLSNAQIETTSQLNDRSSQNSDLLDTQKLNSVKLSEFVNPSDEKQKLVDAQMQKLSDLTNPNDQNLDLMDAQLEESSKKGDDNDQIHAKLVEGSEVHDKMEVDDEIINDSETRFSVPSFLKKVFVKEVGDTGDGDSLKLLVIAVHAVLIESGFVGYDPVLGAKVDGFRLADDWPSSGYSICLHYTLPELSSSEVVDTVNVKFQNMGNVVNVYGTLAHKGFQVHRVCLGKSRFVSALSFVGKMSDHVDSKSGNNGYVKSDPCREIFEFWKTVKDGLSYPLLIDLCEKSGLPSPSCFICLPTELKLKILESVPGVDVAKVACACSELHFVCSNNDLWRLKYEEEFGNATSLQGKCQWKSKFSNTWVTMKKRKRLCIPYHMRQPFLFPPIFPGRRAPTSSPFPFVIGGDYDRFPAFGTGGGSGNFLPWRHYNI